eukprot:scaffold3505_cov98-Cylindrotheca_fusiformis.AAC.6
MSNDWRSTRIFLIQAVCLVLHRGNAFVLPSLAITENWRLSSNFDRALHRQFLSPVDDALRGPAYGMDDEYLGESLASMRHSISSIHRSMETTRHALDATSMAVSKATSSGVEIPDMDDAADILKEAMKNLKMSSDGGYFQASVSSIRGSLSSIQHTIEDVRQMQPLQNGALSTSSGAETSHSVPILADYVVSKTHLKPVFEEFSRQGGDLVRDNIHKIESISSATTGYNKQLQEGMARFLENASSESAVIAVNAKIKLGMMVSNTYLMLGLEPPESMARSGAPITPSVSLFAAFFAILWAIGAKEMSRKQTEDNFKIVLREYEKQQMRLQAQMAPMKVEITRLASGISELKADIQVTNSKIERLEFERGLERQFWAAKLQGKRRRFHRMRRQLVSKHAQLDQSKVDSLMETKRSNAHALRILAENGRLIFDKTLEIVSHLGEQIILASSTEANGSNGESASKKKTERKGRKSAQDLVHFAGTEVLQS